MAWPDYTSDVHDRVKALLRPGVSSVDPAWLAPSIADALATCQTDFTSILAGRAYSAAQIQTWAAGPGKPHVISTAFFLVCVDARTDLKDEDGVKVAPPAVLDRRQDWLADPAMTMTDAAGNVVAPDNASTAGGVLHGLVTYAGRQGRGEAFRYADGCPRPW